ncbi:MAG: undecaprenyl-phosphate glucose phosphotransferase [Anaerolineales bacterium]|nr:undecaprenyl-phosphate glucose phosphotransferase [Anaerolineales bacterium]
MKHHRKLPWWVVVADVVLTALSMGIAYWVRYELQWFRDISYHHPPSAYIPFALLLTVLMQVTFLVDRVYQNWHNSPLLDQMHRIINAAAMSTVVLLAVTFVLQPLQYSRLLLIEAGTIAALLLIGVRIVWGWIIAALRRRGQWIERVIIVGAGEIGRTVMRTIVARPQLGYQIVGFVDDDPEKGHTDIGRIKALGPTANLAELVQSDAVDQVIITLPWMYHRKILSIVRECERKHVEARIVPDLFQMSLSQVDVDDLGGIPVIGVHEVAFSRGALLVKRAMDVVLASVMIVLGLPLFAAIALAIRLDSPGRIVFRQTRVGLGGAHFEMYKFRSMREGAENELELLRKQSEVDGPIFKMRKDPRATRVGQFLRHKSLDELPQLWNVLRGEMSIVGPRPPLPSEVNKYMDWHRKRLEVRPGMTGLWQVSGRSLLSFDEMVLLDIHYIEHWSLWLDLKIMLRTVPQIILGEGAY